MLKNMSKRSRKISNETWYWINMDILICVFIYQSTIHKSSKGNGNTLIQKQYLGQTLHPIEHPNG